MKILITGASGYFGKLLAQRLRADCDQKFTVIGVDVRELEEADSEMKFLSGDTRKKRFEDIFKTEGKVDAVVHLARTSSPEMKSDDLMMTNVYGTFHILELARKYGVNRFIFPSSTVVYGARNDNPALIKETFPLLGNRDVPDIRDRVEADMICQTFSAGLAEPRVAILRFAPIWRTGGSGILNQYMNGKFVPTLLGFDPMFQAIYEHEVLEAFMLAIKNIEAEGAFNIPGKLFMPLSAIIKRHDKTPVPLPDFLVHRDGKFLWSKTLRFDFNYLKYPFTVDGAKARETLGYDPQNLNKTFCGPAG